MTWRFITAIAVGFFIAPISLADEIYFPTDDWESVDPSTAGWDQAKLEAALDFAMSRKSSGVVILHRGRMMASRYQDLPRKLIRYQAMVHGKDSSGHAIEDVASVQKSVVSFLVGVAQEKGLVKLSDPVHQHLGVGWSQATPEQESAITIRHTITMSSGLNEKLAFVAEPGTVWQYNSTAYAQSLRAIAAAARKSPHELTTEWLTERVGMKDSRWLQRPWATESEIAANDLGFATTAADLARFGLLIMANGKWRDQTLLTDRAYLRASLSSSQELNRSYGYLWWLNGKEFAVRGSRRVDGPLISTAPSDLVAALGALGRKCYIVPSLEIVVTRLGDSPEVIGKVQFEREFWRLLMQAAPK